MRLSHLDLQFRECQARVARADGCVAAEAFQLLDANALRDVVVQAEAERAGRAATRTRDGIAGANGIGFPTPHAIEPGSLVALNVLLLPERESIMARARVRQARPLTVAATG